MFAHSLGTLRECFKTLCYTLTVEEHAQFENACRGILADLYRLWEATVCQKNELQKQIPLSDIRYFQEREEDLRLSNQIQPYSQSLGTMFRLLTLNYSRYVRQPLQDYKPNQNNSSSLSSLHVSIET